MRSVVLLICISLSSCQYDENQARMLLDLAAGAYGNQQSACLGASGYGGPQTTLQTIATQQCDDAGNTCSVFTVVDNSKQTLIIVFRGTKTDSQLLLEGWTTLQPTIDFYGFGEANAYFLNAHNTLWPNVETLLRQYQSYSVIFTGHSLGAALSSLGAARTVINGLRNGSQIKVVNFGQPRVGDFTYAQKFDQQIPNTWRVVFRRDIVPHLPGCKKTKDFDPNIDVSKLDQNYYTMGSMPCAQQANKPYHHGTEVWYPYSMQPGSPYRICTGIPKDEDFTCSDQIRFNLKNSSQYIWDHRHYFAVSVPSYGEAGCNRNLPEGEKGETSTQFSV